MEKQIDILQKIVSYKKKWVASRKCKMSIEHLREEVLTNKAPVVRPFLSAIEKKISTNQPAVIAELKKASPSKGVIRRNFDPEELARTLEKNGATCLSVLTDSDFFQGKNLDLELAKKNCALPILRKDFIVDSYQIYEARHIGADCILLIVGILNADDLQNFYHLAQELNLDVIIEVHDSAELKKALAVNPKIIGINNRDLKTFEVSLETTLELAKKIPEDCVIVCESGINSKKDINHISQHNIHTFLIGETLMREPDPGKKLRELLNPSPACGRGSG